MALRHKFTFELDEEVFVNGEDKPRIILGRCFHPENETEEKEQYLFTTIKGDRDTFTGDPEYDSMRDWVSDILDEGGVGDFSVNVGIFDRVKWIGVVKIERISPLVQALRIIKKEIGL